LKTKKFLKPNNKHSSGDGEIRDNVLKLFTNTPSLSIKFNNLVSRLRISRYEKAHVRGILRILISDGSLFKRGKYYELSERKVFYEGKVVYDENMEYAIETKFDNNFERIKVRKRNMQTALIDDIVEFAVIEFAEDERKEAVIERIIKRAKHRITGNLQFSKGNKDFAFVVPDDKTFRKDIYIPVKNLKNAKDKEKVVCEITGWEYQDISPEGKIIEVLGKAGEVETEFKALLEKYGLNKNFSKKVKEEININLEDPEFCISGKEILNRIDLRNETIFTIDPVDAKDFDDAVHVRINEKGNFLLGVHIADVGFFVREKSNIDEEAFRRGTSVYLMNDVVPMLPEKLSNDLCSLKEKEDRFTFSVNIEINPKGDILNFNLFKSVINSKKRFTYEEVQKILDDKHGVFVEELNLMNKLHKILYKKRLSEGSLDFETQEVIAEIDENGNIKNIRPKERLESMRMIEDFMLIANKCVTLYIQRKEPRLPFIYRIHDIPDKKKMKELAFFVKQFGIHLNSESKKSIQNMLEHIRGREEEYLINDLTIRSMSKAVYSEENIGHYGLGFEYYTHFTSPIRRYPDLIVHRILYESLKKMSFRRINHYREILPEICKQSTDMEINAVQAEREAIKILQIKFLEKHVGELFSGIISGITEYGLYVEISKYLIEGMVRLSDLKDDYYILDERNYRLIGRNRKKTYRIGDKVKVKVFKLDKEKKWIDFQLIS
jgi:ribonuclease R